LKRGDVETKETHRFVEKQKVEVANRAKGPR
jgi:hypothetical protein